MNIKIVKSFFLSFYIIGFVLVINSCQNTAKETNDSNPKDSMETKTTYPSDVIPFMDKFKILLGDGTNTDNLVNYEAKDFFYTANDGKNDWVVYKLSLIHI